MALSRPSVPISVPISFPAEDFALVERRARAGGVSVEEYVRELVVEEAREEERLASKLPPPLPWPNRMTLVPEPLPGESFMSWMDALARENGCGRNVLLMEFWRTRRSPHSYTHRLGEALSEDGIARITAATGLSTAAVEALRLNRYRSGIPALEAEGAWSERPRAFIMDTFSTEEYSRWCPQCIAETGGRWFLRWKLAWSYACVKHEVFLNIGCPACGEVQDYHNGPPDLRLRCPARPGAGRDGGKRCEQQLAEAPARRVTDPRLIELQRWIDYGFGEGERPRLGRSASALFDYPATLQLIQLLQTPPMFAQADPAIAEAMADGALRRPTMYVYPGEVHDPVVMAGIIGLADELMTSRTGRAAWFADLAQAGRKDAPAHDREPLSLRWIAGLVFPWLLDTLKDRGLVTDSH